MPTLDESFPALLDALADRAGRPAPLGATVADPFRAVVAVFLSCSLEDRPARAALSGLAEAGLLDPRMLAAADPLALGETLRDHGANVPTKVLGRLARLAQWLWDCSRGRAETLDAEGPVSTVQLRDGLLAINGIGPATADTLLLFGLHRPVYPVDRASYRVLVRHGWLEPSAGYDEARDVIERQCAEDPDALALLSRGLEQIGREFCRAGRARCDRCPLRPFLPPEGPIEPEGVRGE